MITMSMYAHRADYEDAVRQSNAADWNATMALKAYRKRQHADYRRHIAIADELRSAFA